MAARSGGGKERASRIPLDYYKKRDAIARWKLGLSLLAVLFAMGWWATGFSLGGPGLVSQNATGFLRASHGPLNRVHATWDARCDACHASFQPIGQDAWTAKVGLTSRAADTKCRSCHAVEDHHPTTSKSGDLSSVACAGCHRDHQGRDGSLVRLLDSDCTSCHKALNGHTESGASAFAASIASFSGNHPEFRLISEKQGDLGTLKFNHALHMSPGLIAGKGQKPLFTVADLGPEDRDRYARGQKLSEGVKLDCASCHRLENGIDAPPSSSAGTSGQGAYMRPITYRTDCAACHKLDVRVPFGEASTTVTVPHRLQIPDLHEALTNAAIGLTLSKDLRSLESFPQPDREFKMPGRQDPARDTARKAVETLVTKAQRSLLGQGKGTCTECHQYKNADGKMTSVLDLAAPLDDVEVEPTFVETVWYKHGKFDHSAHRAVSCRDCHEGAYPEAKEPSTKSADVLIPGKASCIRCHAPEGRDPSGHPTGGAGQTCTECHTYHNGDLSPGMKPSAPMTGMSFAEFLKGNRDGKSP